MAEHSFLDASLDASVIEVAVTDGEVTLAGTVDGKAAEEFADDQSGVKRVQNNIRVKAGSGQPETAGETGAGHFLT